MNLILVQVGKEFNPLRMRNISSTLNSLMMKNIKIH
jgi:hypothetical protein